MPRRSFAFIPFFQEYSRVSGSLHLPVMIGTFGGQFDDVAVGIPEVDGVNEPVIGNSPAFHFRILTDFKHLF